MVDALVIGGGHNGLTAAARLAKRGREVVVLERSQALGGLAASEEFHPGYRTAGALPDTTMVSQEVVDLLDLEGCGLARATRRPDVLFVQAEGPSLLLAGERRAAADEIAHHSTLDAERYGEWRAFIEKISRVVEPLRREAPPDVMGTGFQALLEAGTAAVALRRLGKRDMLEMLRIAPMCAADYLNEWFETDLLRAGLAVPGIASTWLGPWSPGSNLNLLFWECCARGAIHGDGAALVRALEAAARSLGVTIRTGTEVRSITVEGGRATGVELADGEAIAAPVVLATCDPVRALLDLVPLRALPQRLEQRIGNFRTRGTTAIVHLALSGPLEFTSRPGDTISRARTGATLDDLERAFDGVKYDRLPVVPTLEIFVPSVAQPALAPPGGAVVTLHVHHVPFELEGGWNDERRIEVGALAVETLARHAPGVRDAIVGGAVLTPADLAERYALTGGHLHHGEHALDQLVVRPTPETARYATPIEGLYLGGSGSHPGGGLTGLPGWLAAASVLRA